MQIQVLKSKLHRVRVTEANINYIGSITIDEDLMDAANLIENEKFWWSILKTQIAWKPMLSKEKESLELFA